MSDKAKQHGKEQEVFGHLFGESTERDLFSPHTGRTEKEAEHKKEEEIFETVDDYVEQA